MYRAVSALKKNKAGSGIRVTGVRMFTLVREDGGWDMRMGHLSRELEGKKKV